jgi:hypothetical protein
MRATPIRAQLFIFPAAETALAAWHRRAMRPADPKGGVANLESSLDRVQAALFFVRRSAL